MTSTLLPAEHLKLTTKDYRSETKVTWCPGCGDHAVLAGLQKAMANLQLLPKDVCIISGIGCSSNLPQFVKTYGFHTLHGRAIPVASGVRLVNPNIKVIITGGDGDGYGIGVGHFIHGMRRNLDVCYIVMNNEIYGLTTGQASPTSGRGHETKSSPEGTIEDPINPIALALASGATYIARAFSGDPKTMADLIAKGIEHKGFALVDVQSPCVTYNKVNTYEWFRERVYDLQATGHDSTNIQAAYAKALEWGDKIPMGLFWKTERPSYEDLEPALKKGPVTTQPMGFKAKGFTDEQVLKEFL